MYRAAKGTWWWDETLNYNFSSCHIFSITMFCKYISVYIFDLIIFFFFLFRISSILVKTLWSPPIKSSLTATSRRKSSSSARFFQVRFHTHENETQQIVYEIVLSKYCVRLNNKGVLIYSFTLCWCTDGAAYCMGRLNSDCWWGLHHLTFPQSCLTADKPLWGTVKCCIMNLSLTLRPDFSTLENCFINY